MYVFKPIDQSQTVFEGTIVHYDQTLNTGSEGLSFVQFVSGSISESYWQSLNLLFYTSGSPTLNEQNSTGLDKFDYQGSNFSIYNPTNPQYVSKFHNFSTGSVISISQRHFGDKIKTNSFKLTDNSNPSSSIIVTLGLLVEDIA